MNRKRTRLHHFFLLVCSAFSISGEAEAGSIGSDCEPSGFIAISQEAWDPVSFWTSQLKEIQDYVEGERITYRMAQVERKRDRANNALDAEEMRVMGIPRDTDPELDREFAKSDRELAALDLELLQISIEWGQKCTAHARQKILELK